MLVDDEPMVVQDTLSLLDWEGEGFTVVGTATNGRAAWELYREKRPQIVIADICMPVMDGLGLAEKIMQAGDEVVVLLLTSHENFQYAQSAMHLGVSRYLLKHELDSVLLLRELNQAREQLQKQSGTVREKTAEPSPYSRSLTAAIQYIKQHYNEDLCLDEVAGASGISGVYLSQLFKRETGETFVEYLTGYRITVSKRLLEEGKHKIREVSELAGFNSSQYFSQVFRRATGQSPQDYRDSTQPRPAGGA